MGWAGLGWSEDCYPSVLKLCGPLLEKLLMSEQIVLLCGLP